MRKARPLVIGFGLLALVFLFYLLRRMKTEREHRSIAREYVSCYTRPINKGGLPKFEWKSHYKSLRHIFFLETSCSGVEPVARLSCRQACAVESAAIANPNTLVHLLFVSPGPPTNQTRRLLSHLGAYDNVEVNRINVDDVVRHTPVERWFGSWVFRYSPWPLIDMSDILRLVIVWKYGGTYLDLDFIITKSLEDLDNFSVRQDPRLVATGAFGFNTTGVGREVADACLKALMRDFDHSSWGSIGPDLMTRVLLEFCNVTEAEDMSSQACHGFRVLSNKSFYPVHWNDWRFYFQTENINGTMELINKSRGIHVWNKLSASGEITKDRLVPYTLVAQKNCPLIYQNCGTNF